MTSIRSMGSVRGSRDRPATPAPASEPDEQLLRRFADLRDEAAFAELVRRHGPMVLGACRRLLGDPHEADDAFQATFLVLARKAGSIERPDRLSHWLYGVAVRVSRRAKALGDRRRRREGGAMGSADAGPVDDSGRQEQRLARREAIEAVHEELARLPEKYRAPVLLCDLGGLTHAEAARRLRWPEGSLSVRLMRARRLLRDRLGRRGLAPSAVLIAAAAFPRSVPAAVPPALADATVRAAVRFAGGPAPVAGAAEGPAPGLAEHALASISLGQAASAAAFGVAVGLSMLAAGLLVRASAESGPLGAARVAPATAPGSAPQAIAEPPRDSAQAVVEVREVGRDLLMLPVADGRPAAGPGPRSSPEDRSTYRMLTSRAGRDADAQVRLALWCESRGLAPERLKHLALAVNGDPGHAAARGLLGQVSYLGRWRRAEEVGGLAEADTGRAASLAEYRARRVRADDAESQWKLALWCERVGLDVEAVAHLAAVTRLDPGREAAWRRLGYQKQGGRWVRPGQVAAGRAESEARRKADGRWGASLAKAREGLRDPSRRARAEAELAGVTDPRAVPAIVATFGGGGPADQAVGVRLLGQFDAPASSRALALLAAFGRSAEVRRAAAETAALRDPGETAGVLIGLLGDRLKFEVRPVEGPGSPGILFVEGERSNTRRIYAPPMPPPEILEVLDQILNSDFDPITTAERAAAVGGAAAQPIWMAWATHGRRRTVEHNFAEARRATLAARDQLGADIGALRAFNDQILLGNRPIVDALAALTGKSPGSEREPWARWWVDQLGYAYKSAGAPKPTFDEDISLAYQPDYRVVTGSSCFGAGTPVHTPDGPRAIETLQLGDRVLAQDTTTGALDYRPVLGVRHNPPAATLRVAIGGEAIEATGIHRFWVAGRGWVMARDLKPGDPVRVVGSRAEVRGVESGEVRPVFNLEVGSSHSYFVGRRGALVHDDSPVRPVADPFDAETDRPRAGDGPAGGW